MQNESAQDVDQKMLGEFRRPDPRVSFRLNFGQPDANAAYAYYSGDYRKSLSIILGGSYTAYVPELGAATTEDETTMKEKAKKVSREMFDVAMRACVRLEDSGWAGYLADTSSKYVRVDPSSC